ncbi:MAG: hypothetical protein VX899_00475 [Myxococcota bacterium]|nr:hypothetical protein [Myxococcota bacterium]
MPNVSRVTDIAVNPADSHGKPCCPHPVAGPGIMGAATILVEGNKPLRIGDPGVHAACCGPNVWAVLTGSGTVYFENIAVARIGDITVHCGGVGALVTGAGKTQVG